MDKTDFFQSVKGVTFKSQQLSCYSFTDTQTDNKWFFSLKYICSQMDLINRRKH